MKIYSHKTIRNVYIVGDCHGDLKSLFNCLKKKLMIKEEDAEPKHPREAEWQKIKTRMLRPITGRVSPFTGSMHIEMPQIINESVYIVYGNCGFGSNKPEFYESILSRYNKILEYNNSFLYFIRGAYDDPSYFDGKMVNLSNIKAIPDYSVIETAKYNILCIGGGLSLDRKWKIEQENRINKFSKGYKRKLYWPNEMPVFKPEEIAEICKSIKINCVISHSSPSFIPPETPDGIDEWSETDDELINDSIKERTVIDRVFEALRDNNSKPTFWAYGHFNVDNITRCSGVIFKGINVVSNIISIDNTINCFEVSEHALKKRKKKIEAEALEEIMPIGNELHEEHIIQENVDRGEEEQELPDLDIPEEGDGVDNRHDEEERHDEEGRDIVVGNGRRYTIRHDEEVRDAVVGNGRRYAMFDMPRYEMPHRLDTPNHRTLDDFNALFNQGTRMNLNYITQELAVNGAVENAFAETVENALAGE